MLSLAYLRMEGGARYMWLAQLMMLVGGLGREVEGIIC